MATKTEYPTNKHVQTKPVRKKFFTSQDWAGYAFSAPLVIGVLVFAIYPMIGVDIKFQKVSFVIWWRMGGI